MRAGVLAEVSLDVAERADFRHGRRAGRERAGHRARRRAGPHRQGLGRGRARRLHAADPRPVRAPGPPLLRQRAYVGRRHHRPRRDADGVGIVAECELEPAHRANALRCVPDVGYASYTN